jgi:hypothetical protein
MKMAQFKKLSKKAGKDRSLKSTTISDNLINLIRFLYINKTTIE